MPYDGLDILLTFLDDDGGLANHLIKSTLFFKPESVREQAETMFSVFNDVKLPVRFSTGKYSYTTSSGDIRRYANKKEAMQACDMEDISTDARPGIRISIDKDGNYSVRREIKLYTGETVSTGRRSTIKNYMISHIWGNTADPLFFSALWNVALIPMHCAFILDKPDSHREQIKDVKELYKAICWTLYRPDRLLNIKFDDVPAEPYLTQARHYIENDLLNFI